MKYVVLGAGGQLGQDFKKWFEMRGCDYKAFRREELDITDFEKVREVLTALKPDVIINCAAYNRVDAAEQEREEAFLVNAEAVGNLARVSKAIGAVLIHFSTDYVFDGRKREPYTTDDLPNPINRYGESKLEGEQLLAAETDRYFLIRVSWVFGKGNVNFARKVLQWASKNERLRIVDDQISSPSYTKDLVEASLELLSSARFGLYHMSNSGFCSRYEWASEILRLAGWKGVIERAKSREFPTAAVRPEFSALDNSLLEETIGRGLPHWKEATRQFMKELSLL